MTFFMNFRIKTEVRIALHNRSIAKKGSDIPFHALKQKCAENIIFKVFETLSLQRQENLPLNKLSYKQFHKVSMINI